VDFSKENIRYFTNGNWIEYLKYTGLMLIIVSDRHMQSLAGYWQKEEVRIQTVIYSDFTLDEINKQINGCYFGLKGDVKKKINALTTHEVQFLDLAVNGYSLPVIASQMKLETKKVYNIKESVRRKMGINLNQLLSV